MKRRRERDGEGEGGREYLYFLEEITTHKVENTQKNTKYIHTKNTNRILTRFPAVLGSWHTAHPRHLSACILVLESDMSAAFRISPAKRENPAGEREGVRDGRAADGAV